MRYNVYLGDYSDDLIINYGRFGFNYLTDARRFVDKVYFSSMRARIYRNGVCVYDTNWF